MNSVVSVLPCNPWYIQARKVAMSLPSGIDRILHDLNSALHSLSDPKYISLHSSIFQSNEKELHQQLANVSDAITEVFQFLMSSRNVLSTRPHMTLQLALSDWMTNLPSAMVKEIAHSSNETRTGDNNKKIIALQKQTAPICGSLHKLDLDVL